MIPLRLQLKNFLSYGPEIQTIDFTPYNLICLSGKNGHGKSAMLDAMTWAIWGKARKTSGTVKADEGLVRLGQTQMMVCIDFEFNQKLYRIRREFALTYGKPYAALDLGIIDKETQQIASLTDKTIKATQEKIELLLGLDYDSFVNSAFLRQGQSNEFSQKSPKDRKEILARILGLERFEQLRKRALDKIKELSIGKEHMLTSIERLSTELNQEPLVAEQHAQAQHQLTEIALLENNLQQSITLLKGQQHAVDAHLKESDLIRYKLNTTTQEQQVLTNKLLTLRNSWHTIHRQQLSLPRLELVEQEKKEVQSVLIVQQQLLHKNMKLKEEHAQQKERVNAIARTLQEQFLTHLHTKKLAYEKLRSVHEHQLVMHSDVEKQLEQARKEQVIINSSLTSIRQNLAASASVEINIKQQEEQFDKRKNYYQKYSAQGNMLTKELEQLTHKQQFSHDETNPSCPMCEQNLSASRKKFLKIKFTKQDEFLRQRLVRLTKIVVSLKQLLIEQHAQLTTLRKSYEQHSVWVNQEQERLAALSKTEAHLHTLNQHTMQLIANIAKSDKDMREMLLEIDKLQESEKGVFTSNHAYQEAARYLNSITEQLSAIDYHADKHTAFMQRYEALEQQLKAYETIRQSLPLQQQYRIEIHELIKQLKQHKQAKHTLIHELQSFASIEQQRTELAQHEESLFNQLKVHQHAKEQILQEKGKLENQQQALSKVEQEITQHKKTIEHTTYTIEDYQAITQALGKDGIQAFLIEDAIPEIELEANHLLSQLTDNQAHIFIESLRDLKKGGTKETLDIKISDPMGVRPYELFSGGEAFRIDFALRIAISKLLARRAGTSLQTLIIDEGFGSQDEEGLSRIMEAIHKIQDNFSKVIIVSHLPSMKEQFPVHFVIEKLSNGSAVRVVEQG